MSKESEKQLAEALQRVPLFSVANQKQRITLAKLGRILTWADGKEGVKQGSAGAAFFLILEGAVEVTRDGVVVARLRDGDFFGEAALLTGGKRNASVTAVAPTRLFSFGRPAFAGIVRTNPDIALKLLEAMAVRHETAL